MSKLVPIVIAVCCLLVLGAAAASMDSAVQTDPDEVITSERFSLPYDSGTAAVAMELKEDIEDELEEARADPAEDQDEGDAEDEQDADTTDEDEPADADDAGELEADDDAAPAESGSADSQELEAEDDDWLAAFLAWLRGVFASFLPLVLLMMAVVGAIVGIVRRDRLWTVGDRFGLPRFVQDSQGRSQAAVIGSPANDIERAWLEMLAVVALEVRDAPENSPREWADAVIAAGANPAAVEELTRTFEEVRFANVPPTEERVGRALAALGRIRRGVDRG